MKFSSKNLFDVDPKENRGFRYRPTATGLAFHESDARVKSIVGPFGSGKTCIIVNDILIYSVSQNVAEDGHRYSRWGVIRPSYPELISGVRPSILEVFPKGYGNITTGGAPLRGLYKFPVGDGPYDWLVHGVPWEKGCGTIAHVEFILQALQNADDLSKIRSINWSGAWLNEANYIDESVFTNLLGRVGRFPTVNDGGNRYSGILMDFNQPEPGHWLERHIRESEDWDHFIQPAAAFKHVDTFGKATYQVNPEAENLVNLGTGDGEPSIERGLEYYQNQIETKLIAGELDEIDSYFCLLPVSTKRSKAVWPSFTRELHVSKIELEPIAYRPLIIGFDTSGIHPATVLFQENMGKWAILDELYGDGAGLETFLNEALIPLIAGKYPTNPIVMSCDPANAKDSFTGLSPTYHLKQAGFEIYLPKTNAPVTRIRAVDQLLNRHAGGLIVSPHCTMVIAAMGGDYQYKRLRIKGAMGDIYDTKPEKNDASHIADAIQYGAMCILREGSEDREVDSAMRDRLIQKRRIMRKIM